MVALAQQLNITALLSSKSNEWYTPSIYVETARQVMGGIDLDPASCEQANQIVKATCYYTKEQNGLLQSLYGRVWCNPPYGTSDTGRSNQGMWVKRIVEDYRQGRIEQAILLTNALTDTRWFHRLFAYPICFTEGRINYFSSIHKTDTALSRPEKSQNTHGSVFTYLGSNEEKFIDAFSQFGTLTRAIVTKRVVAPLNLWEVQ